MSFVVLCLLLLMPNSKFNFVIFRYVLGGPLVRIKDNTLIGLTSFILSHISIFTNIHYYFEWISEVTGIDLPKCGK